MTDQEKKELMEEQTGSEEVFRGVLLHVFRDRIQLPDGQPAIRELIRHIGAVCVIPITDDGRVILERQYRYPVGDVITEIPAGKLDFPTEDRLDAIRRELREETGYTADHWAELGIFYPAPAYSDEKISMYMATGLHKGDRRLDDTEFLNVIEMPLEEAVEKVMDGTITDAKTQIALLKAARLLKI